MVNPEFVIVILSKGNSKKYSKKNKMYKEANVREY